MGTARTAVTFLMGARGLAWEVNGARTPAEGPSATLARFKLRGPASAGGLAGLHPGM